MIPSQCVTEKTDSRECHWTLIHCQREYSVAAAVGNSSEARARGYHMTQHLYSQHLYHSSRVQSSPKLETTQVSVD